MPRFNGIPVEESEPRFSGAPVKSGGPRFGGVPVSGQPKSPVKQNPAPEDDGFSVSEMAGNVPSSAANLAKNIWRTISNPVDTARGIGGTIKGVGVKLNNELEDALPDPLKWLAQGSGEWNKNNQKYSAYADAVKNGVIARYGSLEAAANTVEQDPVGFLADLSAVVSPFSPRAAAAINPVNVAGNTVKYAAGKVLPKNLPRKMYESSAKFSTVKDKADRDRAFQTALDQGILPTQKGADKLQGLIDDFNGQIDGLITASTSSNATVPVKRVFQHIKDLRRKYGRMNLDAPTDVQAINKLSGEFAKLLHRQGKKNLTARELQDIKVKAYQRVKYDASTNSTASQAASDTRKQVARGAKDGVEELIPETKQINSDLSDLYNLQDPLVRASNRIENKNFFSINDAPQIGVGTVAGNALAGPPGAAVGASMGFLVSLLGRDKIKAFNAVQLNRIIKDANLMTFLKNNPQLSQAEMMAAIAGRHPIDETQ